MEHLLKDGRENMSDPEFCKKQAHVFNFSCTKGLAGKPSVRWTEVQKWFQDRQRSDLPKDAPVEVAKKLAPVSDDRTLMKKNENSEMPEGERVSNLPKLEFEAKSAKDGAWSIIDVLISFYQSPGHVIYRSE